MYIREIEIDSGVVVMVKRAIEIIFTPSASEKVILSIINNGQKKKINQTA